MNYLGWSSTTEGNLFYLGWDDEVVVTFQGANLHYLGRGSNDACDAFYLGWLDPGTNEPPQVTITYEAYPISMFFSKDFRCY